MIRAALAKFALVEFPIMALVLFIAAWAVIVLQAWSRSAAEVERLSTLPLDDGAAVAAASPGAKEEAR